MIIIFVPLLAAGAFVKWNICSSAPYYLTKNLTPFEQSGLAAGESWIC
jgi:hypothetical protein